jgi:hypothetical protein
MSTPEPRPKIRRPCDLKREHQKRFPESDFFAPESMKWAGDTMANFSVRKPKRVRNEHGVEFVAYELARMRPSARLKLTNSNWFHAETFDLVPGKFFEIV